MNKSNSGVVTNYGFGYAKTDLGFAEDVIIPWPHLAKGYDVEMIRESPTRIRGIFSEKFDEQSWSIYEVERLMFGESGSSAHYEEVVFNLRTPDGTYSPDDPKASGWKGSPGGGIYPWYGERFIKKMAAGGRHYMETVAYMRHKLTDYDLNFFEDQEIPKEIQAYYSPEELSRTKVMRRERRRRYNLEILQAYPQFQVQVSS